MEIKGKGILPSQSVVFTYGVALVMNNHVRDVGEEFRVSSDSQNPVEVIVHEIHREQPRIIKQLLIMYHRGIENGERLIHFVDKTPRTVLDLLILENEIGHGPRFQHGIRMQPHGPWFIILVRQLEYPVQSLGKKDRNRWSEYLTLVQRNGEEGDNILIFIVDYEYRHFFTGKLFQLRKYGFQSLIQPLNVVLICEITPELVLHFFPFPYSAVTRA